MNNRALPLLALAGTVLLAATGCASGSGASSEATKDDRVAVVASTDVYGDLVSSVGGAHVDVTSIIDSPDQDPHEYSADARTQLAVSRAQLIVANGGGYDDFIGTMVDAATSEATVIDASDVSGYDQAGEFNEHVWYDLPTVSAVVERISASLSALDPANEADYTANAAALETDLDALIAKERQLRTLVAGQPVAITEPVPLYLLDAVGLVNATPPDFSEAVEEGTDVPATTLRETLALFSDKKVEALVYNEQTEGTQTDAVLEAAKKAGIPAVGVTETLPEGKDYVSWMSDTIDAVQGALGA